MKKIASLTGILLVLMAGASFAAGLNLAWDNCRGAGGIGNKTVACATVTTAQTLYGSFVLASGLNVTSTTNQLDIQVDSPTVGTFWTLSGAGLGSRFGFDANDAPSCPSWQPTALALDNVNGRTQVGNRIQLRINLAIGDFGNDIAAGVEALSYRLSVNMADAATAPDCSLPACFVFNRSFIEDAFNGFDATLTNPQTSQHVTWQGGGTLNCPAATPVQKKTWGSIKALYR